MQLHTCPNAYTTNTDSRFKSLLHYMFNTFNVAIHSGLKAHRLLMISLVTYRVFFVLCVPLLVFLLEECSCCIVRDMTGHSNGIEMC